MVCNSNRYIIVFIALAIVVLITACSDNVIPDHTSPPTESDADLDIDSNNAESDADPDTDSNNAESDADLDTDSNNADPDANTNDEPYTLEPEPDNHAPSEPENERSRLQYDANNLMRLEDRNYVVTSQNIIVTKPTTEEKRKVIKYRSQQNETKGDFDSSSDLYLPQEEFSVDPKSGHLYQLDSENVLLDYNIVNIYGEETRSIELKKFQSDSGIELITERTSAISTINRSPNGGYYLFEDNDSIFIIDAKNMEIRELTLHEIDGIFKLELWKSALDSNKILYWATNPTWSPDGAKVSYTTNRSISSNSGSEIRVIDILDESDKKLYSNEQPVGIIGWTNSNTLLIWEYSQDRSNYFIRELSLDGVLGPIILQDVDVIDLSPDGKYILYSESRPSTEMLLLDIETLQKSIVLSLDKGIQFDPTAIFSPNSDKVVGLTHLDYSGGRAINIQDIRTGEHQLIYPEDGEMFTETPYWINSDMLLVNGKKDGVSTAWILNSSSFEE